jgi:hypothetical protein
MINSTFILLVLFFCHFLADYTWLSTSWMLNAKRFGKPIYPIFVHAFIHASLMLVVLSLGFGQSGLKLLLLFLFQLITHWLIDIWKGRMNIWFPKLQNPANKEHWIIFGFDQYLHAAVIVIMVHFVK